MCSRQAQSWFKIKRTFLLCSSSSLILLASFFFSPSQTQAEGFWDKLRGRKENPPTTSPAPVQATPPIQTATPLPAVVSNPLGSARMPISGPENQYVIAVTPRPDVPFPAVANFKVSPDDSAATVALKAGDLLSSVHPALQDLALESRGADIQAVGMVLDQADQLRSTAQQFNARVDQTYREVANLETQLEQNYQQFDQSARKAADAQQFTASVSSLADRVAQARQSLGNTAQTLATSDVLMSGMKEMVQDMRQNGQAAVQYAQQLENHLGSVSTTFEQSMKELQTRGWEAPNAANDARQFLQQSKSFARASQATPQGVVDYLQKSEQYLEDTRQYAMASFNNSEAIEGNLIQKEEFFRNLRVSPADGGANSLGQSSGDNACAGAKSDKPLKPLQECQKDCRTVCRWKENVGDTHCYECPSGSPDSCYDIKAWPDNHPWCQPGGICHADPMLYCVMFGAVSPENKEHLSCANCKKRDDMCWQKVQDGTTTLTNCKLGCSNGKCVYKGKYVEKEWDRKDEFIHCYKCELPPGPPSCEDLGWGTTWKSDCEANCPAPGECKLDNHKVPGAVPPPAQPGQPGAPGGQPVGGDAAGGGTQGKGGAPTGGSGGRPGNPPTGSPTQPEGPGGGGVAPTPGGSAGTDAGQPTPPSTPRPTPPPTTQPKNPPPPQGERPTPPSDPLPPPPANATIEFYKKWLTEVQERIKSREAILENPNEGEQTKAEAQRQLESMTKERDKVQQRVNEEEAKERERLRQEQESKDRAKRSDETRVRPPDYAEEARRLGRKWHLDRLREATDALKKHLQEMKDVYEGRAARLQKIDDEIARLERENQHYTDGAASGNVDQTVSRNQIKANTDRLNQLKAQRAQLAKKFEEVQRQYNAELERLRSEYQRRYWAVDENARRRAAAQRVDEYEEIYNDLRHREATRKERMETFNSLARDLENQIKDKEARGENADELKEKLENLKRGQAEWDASLQRQEENLKAQLHELEKRNFFEGAGPSSPEDLVSSLGRFSEYMQQDLANAQKAISELEGRSTRTAEESQRLADLKNKASQLQAAIDGAKARQEALSKPHELTTEEAQRVQQTTTRVAAGAMTTPEDKSFLRLAGESIAEEAVHNLNPIVMAKKSLAFGYGVAEGVVSSVAGLVELGVGAVVETVDTLGEAIAVDLGYEDGGIFGTDNLDTINGLVSGVANASSYANFDTVIAGVVKAGGIIDAKIKELEKASDVDTATARFGGRVAGEVAVGDAVIAGALGKAGTILRGADEVADLNKATNVLEESADATKAMEKLDDAARAGSQVADNLNDTVKLPPFEPPPSGLVDEAAAARNTAGKVDDLPTTTPKEAPPARAPPESGPTKVNDPTAPTPEVPKTTPPRGGVAPNSQASYVGPDGKQVVVKTGDELGHGSTSVVYADPSDAKKAIRITEPGRGGITEAPKLDAAGRQAVESIQRPGGPIRITEKGNPVTVSDPNSPLNGKIVEVVERLENGSADKFLASRGGQMSSGQAKAFVEATEELNKNGFTWMDNHTGNYGFEEVTKGSDQWRVVVLDPGGIVPMQGATLAEKADNARKFQQALNASEEGMADFLKYAKSPDRGPDFFKNFVDKERARFMNEFGGSIDAAAMGLKSPNDVAFYPLGTAEFPEVQAFYR